MLFACLNVALEQCYVLKMGHLQEILSKGEKPGTFWETSLHNLSLSLFSPSSDFNTLCYAHYLSNHESMGTNGL